jgi:hypothetical protein
MCRIRLKCGQVGELPKAPKDVWNNQKYGAGTLKFPHAKEFITDFASPVRSRKLVENIGLMGRSHVLGCPCSYVGRYFAMKSFLMQGTLVNE